MTKAAQIVGLWRYPVKGLQGQARERLALAPNQPIEGDRRYAIARPDSAFDPEAPRWYPKREFLQLVREPGLAAIRAEWDELSGSLTLTRGFGQGDSVSADPEDQGGRRTLERFLADALGSDGGGELRLVRAPGVTFSDTGRPIVSILSVATIEAIAAEAGMPLHPARFRGNILVDGLAAWDEFGLAPDLELGAARLRVVDRIGRCMATTVNPASGERDAPVLKLLETRFGHTQCGIYAEIVSPGEVRIGDRLFEAG